MVVTTPSAQRLAKLQQSKAKGEPIVALTAYDYPSGRLLDEAGIDIILVGDSLGMVVLGYEDTTSVTLDEMLHHTRACRRGVSRALLVGDLPFGTYDSPEQALQSAIQLRVAGADLVKLEGGIEKLPEINAILQAKVPVIGHIGMLPQQVRIEGGYKKKGKTPADAAKLMNDAMALAEAGVSAIVLESMVATVAEEITKACSVPTIGVGAGTRCDGQILVLHDLIGAFPWFRPKFAANHADVAGEIRRAVGTFVRDVRGSD